MLTGHTKSSCDWCFGLFKRLFRKTKVDCLEDIAQVVSNSAKGNIPQLCGNEKGEMFVTFYDWTSFLKQFFRKVKQIKKYHNFSFSHDSGILKIKEFSDSETVEQNLLVRSPSMDEMPTTITPVEVTVLKDHMSIGRRHICITGYDPPYACACFRRYEPLRDASQSLTESPRVNFYVTSWSGTPRCEFTQALQHS